MRTVAGDYVCPCRTGSVGESEQLKERAKGLHRLAEGGLRSGF